MDKNQSFQSLQQFQSVWSFSPNSVLLFSSNNESGILTRNLMNIFQKSKRSFKHLDQFVTYNIVNPCCWYNRLTWRDTGSFPSSGQRLLLDTHQLLHLHALQCPSCNNVSDREYLLCFGISWGEAWWNAYVLFIYFMFYVWEELSGFFLPYWGKRSWFCSFH